MIEEAQEKEMDSVASFKTGGLLTITERQYRVCSQTQMINLLVSSNRYGYIFYATETDGLAIIPSAYIDRESQHLTKSSEADDEDDQNSDQEKPSIIHRSYIPGQLPTKNPSILPCWIALNADETILALVLSQLDTRTWLIIFYDVVKLIQIPDSQPLCPPIRLSNDSIGGTIQYFTWNPVMTNTFALLDGHGSVSSFEIDLHSRQLKNLGKSDADDDNSSICWSPKGKQIVVVKYDGALELYEPNLKLKKKHPSATINPSFPPCISVLWITTPQFLLGFSENSPDENTNDNTFFHILVTYEKDQAPKTQIYNYLFFDAPNAPTDINPQYFYVRLNESKTIISGLTKSIKINVLGLNELNQDSLDIWTFEDQFRAIVKGSTQVKNEKPILTGMALGLNSTLSISQGNQNLPSCPMLLLSNSHGLLQVFYFIHPNLSSLCRPPEDIQPIQTPEVIKKSQASPSPNSFVKTSLSSQIPPSDSLQPFLSSAPATNGSSFINVGSTPTTITQSKGTTSSNTFDFHQQPSQPTNDSSTDDISNMISRTVLNRPIPAQQTPIKTIPNNGPPTSSAANNKKLSQMTDDFDSKLKSVKKPLSKLSEPSDNLDQSLEHLITTLNNMLTSLQTSSQSLKSVTSKHIESLTKIEDARHQIKLSQTENLYHLLKDRELDPWTQSRLDSIQNKYNQLKHDLNVLLQLTHTTFHDRSLSTNNDDETENEDFLPDLEISLNRKETLKQRTQKRVLELSHKVSETEKDLEYICTKLKKDLLSSSTFTKTTMSSHGSFHALDAQILSHLQTTHPKVQQIRLPPPVGIHLSSTIEQKKQSTIEIIKPMTASDSPSTPKETNPPTVESESFKNMLRLVKTSIDFFSGVTSPEQLQELSNTIATSPLSSTQKSNAASINKTPTISKTINLSKTSTITKPLTTTIPPTNILQTPAKSVTSPLPTISVTPATPAAQAVSSDASLKLQPNKPIIQTATDLSRTQTISILGDSTIRSLLNNTVSPPTTITSIPSQPASQVIKPPLFGGASSTSTPQGISQSALPTLATITTTTGATPVISTPSSIQSPFNAPGSPATTVTTSVQSTAPTTNPIMSTGFGSFSTKATFGGSAFNFTPTTSSGIPFSGITTATNTGSPFGSAATSTAPSFIPFGGGTSATTTTAPATTSGSSTGSFGLGTSSVPSPFGSGFTTPATSTATTTVPTPGIFGGATTSTSSRFGGGFGGIATTPTTTSASSTGAFASGFGSNTTATSPFGSSFNTGTSTPSASPFGGSGGFGSSPSTSSGTAFCAPASFAPVSTASSSIFGSSGGFGFTSTLPVTSTATSTAAPSVFGGGGGTSTFGSGFAGFNTPSNSSGQSGFSFGGFGAHPTDASTTQSGFGAFGSPPAATQASSPFGASSFGGASGQSPGFGTATSSFGASSTQTASSASFTTYRK